MKTDNKMVPASFQDRLLAYLIDLFIWMLLCLLPLHFLSQIESLAVLINQLVNTVAFYWLPLTLIYSFLIYLGLITYLGGTPGKLILGLRILDSHASFLDIKKAFFREYITKVVSAGVLFAGYFAMLWHPKKKTWHDMLSGSLVMTREPQRLLGLTVSSVLLIIVIYNLYVLKQDFINNQSLQTEIEYVLQPLESIHR